MGAKFRVGELCYFGILGQFEHLVWIVTAEPSNYLVEDDRNYWMYEFRYAKNPHTYGRPIAFEYELRPSSLLEQLTCPWPYVWDQDNWPSDFRLLLLVKHG